MWTRQFSLRLEHTTPTYPTFQFSTIHTNNQFSPSKHPSFFSPYDFQRIVRIRKISCCRTFPGSARASQKDSSLKVGVRVQRKLITKRKAMAPDMMRENECEWGREKMAIILYHSNTFGGHTLPRSSKIQQMLVYEKINFEMCKRIKKENVSVKRNTA